MATLTLRDFLQNDPIRFGHYNRDQSTSNKAFRISIPDNIGTWTEFTLDNIEAQFGTLLQNVQIATDAQPSTPPPRFAAEDYLRELVAIYADRPVRRALASTFAHMAAHPGPESVGRSPITLGAGSSAELISGFVPDRGFYDPNLDEPINRLPGEIKPSWKWKWLWAHEGHRDYSQAAIRLSQLTFYMLQQGYRQPHSGARYGFMLTDEELVAFRKIDATENILMSSPVPWRGRRQQGQPLRLTVSLALWYLGMLASHDDDWKLEAQPGDPPDSALITA